MIVERHATVDTNILIYAIDRHAGEKQAISQSLIESLVCDDGVVTLQVLGEFFHATTRKGFLSPAEARVRIDYWRDLFHVAAADEIALDDAVTAVTDHGLSFWDAMLWATARQAGCPVLYSEDMQHGRTLGGVEIVNPFLA